MDLKLLFQELDWNLFQTPRDIQERCYRKKIVMVKVCRQSLEDCRGCGQAGQGPACQILQMGGVGEMLSVRYCQILQIIAPTSNSPAVSGQQGRMFASDPVRFYNQSPPVLNKDVWGHGFRGSSDLLQIMDL